MALYYYYTSCFSSTLIVICLMIIATTTDGKSRQLDKVCAGTVDPQLCIEALGGDRGVSLEGAAEVGFQTAGIDSLAIKNALHRIVTSSNSDSFMKSVAGQCEQLYDHVFKGLVVPAKEAARVGRWADVGPSVSRIPADVDACEKLFDDDSPVHGDSQKVKVAAQAIVFIASILSR